MITTKKANALSIKDSKALKLSVEVTDSHVCLTSITSQYSASLGHPHLRLAPEHPGTVRESQLLRAFPELMELYLTASLGGPSPASSTFNSCFSSLSGLVFSAAVTKCDQLGNG